MPMSSQIKQRVMRRVHTVRMLRPLTSDIVVGPVLFAIALYGIGQQVWVERVFANMPSVVDVAAMSRFFIAAFVQTELIVQALVVLAFIAALWVARGLGIALGNALTQQSASRVSA